MSFIFLMLVFITCSFMLTEPMILLVLIMINMFLMLLKMFYMSMDYWSLYMMIMSFLVGLFLLFVYLVSLMDKLYISLKMMKTFSLIHTVMLISISFFLLNNNLQYMNTSYPMSSSSWYEWMYETKVEIIMASLVIFYLIIMVVFFFVKKNKKMMKTSF